MIVHTNRVAPQDVQHACLSDGLKVGSTNHTVDALMHKIRVAQLSCDVQNKFPQVFAVSIRHARKPDPKSEEEMKEIFSLKWKTVL